MEVLREMFGAHLEPLIERALHDAGGSVEAAIEAILQYLEEPKADPVPVVQLNKKVETIDLDSDHEGEDLEFQVERTGSPAFSKRRRESLPGEPPDEASCVTQVITIIPDVCEDYVKKVYHDNKFLQSGNVVEFIVSHLLERGSGYPRSKQDTSRKRKRRPSTEGAGANSALNIYEDPNRARPSPVYTANARRVLQQEFPLFPATQIDRIIHRVIFLTPAYESLMEINNSFENKPDPPFRKLRSPRKVYISQQERTSESYLEVIKELDYVKEKVRVKQRKVQLEADAQLAADLEVEEHEKSGMMMECQCCFDNFPFSGMTQCCEGHLFCMDCARRNAENEVGQGRYKLLCMAGCKSEFPRQEALRFLDAKLKAALEKNEQEEAIRLADLQGLTKCPFCDFAAICQPVELDKEFRCRNPECMEVSCRLCQAKTHIPKSCEEVAKDNTLNIRHAVEEAMTEALVRTCKKCGNKFVKESGCNKMMCTRCRTLQCYVCSQTITGYEHFNDRSRGGNPQNKCPLFDNTEKRHEDEVEKAAKAVVDKIRAENPDISEADLEIKVSDAVKASRDKEIQQAQALQPQQQQQDPLEHIIARHRRAHAHIQHAQLPQFNGFLHQPLPRLGPFMHIPPPPPRFRQGPMYPPANQIPVPQVDMPAPVYPPPQPLVAVAAPELPGQFDRNGAARMVRLEHMRQMQRLAIFERNYRQQEVAPGQAVRNVQGVVVEREPNPLINHMRHLEELREAGDQFRAAMRERTLHQLNDQAGAPLPPARRPRSAPASPRRSH